MRIITSIVTGVLLSSSVIANTDTSSVDMQAQIDALTKEINAIKKDNKNTKKSLSSVKRATGGDNVKFGLDFRNAVDVINYKDNETGKTASNSSLLTSRLFLDMAASPMKGLVFQGKLAIYSTWGSHLYVDDAPFKDWSGSSKPADTVMRVKEAYIVYNTKIGAQPLAFSIGRRPSSNGFLANYRENEPKPASPLAHITNMEVNGAMVKIDLSRFVEGAYTKLVYGRAHSGEMNNVYSAGDTTQTFWGPYADRDTDLEDESVDFFVMPGDAYNDGQYQLMYQWAHIFDTKGKALNGTGTADDVNKAASGVADLFALSFKIDGIGDEINDFLDETTFFISGAYTNYNAKDGYTILGSEDGGTQDGSSVWAGIIIPDMITDAGKLGFEYNHGSQYWTPMTWAEDTAIGSKIAVRGDAYEAYWNFNLFGVKYLPSQIRYTYVQHDYTPNLNCAGWVDPQEVDITAQDIRFAVSYRY